jgi:hypothetical protein
MASLQSFLYGIYSHELEAIHNACPPDADNQIGPIVSHACNRGFDFTLLFEQSILSIGPSVILLLFSLAHGWSLYGQSKKTGPNYTRALKIVRILQEVSERI